MIISGRNPVFEALAAGRAKKIIVRHGASIHFDSIQVPFEVLGRRDFEDKYGIETQGVVAIIDDFKYTEFKDEFKELEKNKGLLLLDKIQDPHNFGAIIRAAHCFGVNTVIVPKHDQAKVTPAVFKSSAGAIFYTKIIEVINLGKTIDELKSIGYTIIATDINGDKKLNKINKNLEYPIGVIIGSEGKGIRDSLLKRADIQLTIPMYTKINSLNASMSAAIVLYQLFVEE